MYKGIFSLSIFAALLSSANIAHTQNLTDSASREATKLPPAVTISTPKSFAESITATADGTLYAGSLLGIIFRARPGEASATPFIHGDNSNSLLATLGIFADERNKLLWACSMPNPFAPNRKEGPIKVLAFELASGAFKSAWPMPTADRAMCNDFAVDTDGTLYITDTPGARIFRIRPGSAALELFAEDRESLAGIDGIAFTGSGEMIVNNIRASTLLRINRDNHGKFAGTTRLTTSIPLQGPDGLRAIGGQRLLQGEGRIGRVTEITIDGNTAQIRILAENIDEPASVAVAAGIGWASESRLSIARDPARAEAETRPFRLIPVARLKP